MTDLTKTTNSYGSKGKPKPHKHHKRRGVALFGLTTCDQSAKGLLVCGHAIVSENRAIQCDGKQFSCDHEGLYRLVLEGAMCVPAQYSIVKHKFHFESKDFKETTQKMLVINTALGPGINNISLSTLLPIPKGGGFSIRMDGPCDVIVQCGLRIQLYAVD